MPTQFIQKMNKTEAGFHLLVLLSLADDQMQRAETGVVLDFLEKHFSEPIDLIKEQAFLRALPREERHNHFLEVAAQFYRISAPEERHAITKFAMDVVMSDAHMQTHENALINELYNAWDLE